VGKKGTEKTTQEGPESTAFGGTSVRRKDVFAHGKGGNQRGTLGGFRTVLPSRGLGKEG